MHHVGRFDGMARSTLDLLDAIAEHLGEERAFLEHVLGESPESESALLEALHTRGLLELSTGYRLWADSLGLPFHPLTPDTVDPKELHRLPIDAARRHRAVAVGVDDGTLQVALSNPFDLLAVDDLQEVLGQPIQVVIAPPTAIDRTLERLERTSSGIEGLIQRLLKAEIAVDAVADADKLRQMVGDDAVVQLVDHLIEEALRARASDIHVEPRRDALRVRIRVDGDLETLYELPAGLHRAVVARIKVIAGMDLGESRKPQDGRVGVSESIELRASVLPSVLGEKAVLRVLDRSGKGIGLGDIGLSPGNEATFRRGFTAPNGVVLVTGPTGSGKTTTLYAALHELNRDDCNLITVEDPVEYEMSGATQVQVDVKAERTFATALRAILRQDPDVVMVGEIRDEETAAIAIQAALTGHMVLSTLHTNDALTTIHRLVDMGVAPYLLGAALRCVVAQRLVARICPDCAVPHVPDQALLAECGVSDTDVGGFRRGSGCKNCRQRGRRGRMALHEVLPITAELASAISRRAPDAELAQIAAGAGFRRMLEDGVAKARQGLVALEDVVAAARLE
ncbi:MAG: hypothetical protein RL398_659 [Planctomycetota bacterium]|jgi:type IV pilus assembly protein PilB